MSFGVADVVTRVCDAAFGRPLVTNVLRSQLVEAMVALALEPEWSWCAADYSAWDFERRDGLRVEVKQSAHLQSWQAPPGGRVDRSFDIKSRTGRWEGPHFVKAPGRAAHIYVFAYHAVQDESADHRDPRQWTFYVVRTADLPSTQRLSLRSVRILTDPSTIGTLRDVIHKVAKMATS